MNYGTGQRPLGGVVWIAFTAAVLAIGVSFAATSASHFIGELGDGDLPAGIVEGIAAVFFFAAIVALLSRSDHAARLTGIAHAVGIAGVLFGMWVLTLMHAERTFNDLYHVAVITAMILTWRWHDHLTRPCAPVVEGAPDDTPGPSTAFTANDHG